MPPAPVVLKKSADREPAISKAMQKVKSELPGSDFAGWGKRLKEEPSLKRKLIGDLKGGYSPARLDEVFGQLKDTVRYTLTLPENNYVGMVEQAGHQTQGGRLCLGERPECAAVPWDQPHHA